MKFRPIEKVRSIIQVAIGLDIMYAYDDLVFAEYGVFLFQFDDEKDNNLFCFYKEDFDSEQHHDQINKLIETCKSHDFTIEFKGRFSMTQVDDEVKINFIKEGEK